MSEYILLPDHTTRRAKNLAEAARQFDPAFNRRVASTHIDADGSKAWVSTVFLVIDHNFMERGKPLLFETMVFGDSMRGDTKDEFTRRYSTWDDAVTGHKQIVDIVLAILQAGTTGSDVRMTQD